MIWVLFFSEDFTSQSSKRLWKWMYSTKKKPQWQYSNLRNTVNNHFTEQSQKPGLAVFHFQGNLCLIKLAPYHNIVIFTCKQKVKVKANHKQKWLQHIRIWCAKKATPNNSIKSKAKSSHMHPHTTNLNSPFTNIYNISFNIFICLQGHLGINIKLKWGNRGDGNSDKNK